MATKRILCLPKDNWRAGCLRSAIESAGAAITDDYATAEGLVWSDQSKASDLPSILTQCPKLEWVQLPFAGVEPFMDMIQAAPPQINFTCGKGVYSRPVAEQILMLALSGFRGLGTYARATTWSQPEGRNLYGSRVTILGGGGIAEELIKMLKPFDCFVTVVRRKVQAMDGVNEVLTLDNLHTCLPRTDLLVLALSLTPETEGVIGKKELSLLPNDAWLINLARGKHVDTDALIQALTDKTIGGAGLDVTEPEPLPEGHPLWHLSNCLITPHIGNTPEMGLPLLAQRVEDNVKLFCEGKTDLVGPVSRELGY